MGAHPVTEGWRGFTGAFMDRVSPRNDTQRIGTSRQSVARWEEAQSVTV